MCLRCMRGTGTEEEKKDEASRSLVGLSPGRQQAQKKVKKITVAHPTQRRESMHAWTVCVKRRIHAHTQRLLSAQGRLSPFHIHLKHTEVLLVPFTRRCMSTRAYMGMNTPRHVSTSTYTSIPSSVHVCVCLLHSHKPLSREM